jgi:hypothetical protein
MSVADVEIAGMPNVIGWVRNKVVVRQQLGRQEFIEIAEETDCKIAKLILATAYHP